MCRDRKTQRALAWLLLLSLVVLLASGVRIHAHSVEHVHEAQPVHASLLDAQALHAHGSAPHLSIDTEHRLGADSFSSEQDLTPKGLIKKLSPLLILGLAVIAFWSWAFGRGAGQRHPIPPAQAALVSRRGYLKPQLRAPPLSAAPI